MTPLTRTLAAVAAAGTVLATSAFAQSAREIRGASPYIAIENEPAPKLIVDPRSPRAWPRASSGLSSGWRTCASYQCLGRAPSAHPHVSGICT
jgi:uncharacterized protein DUF6130